MDVIIANVAGCRITPVDLQRHFGKTVMICDRAPQHRSRLVREFLCKNKNVKITHFRKGSPYLNVVEECWRQTLFVS